MPKRSGTPADDPFAGRHPTSHERNSGLPWDASYHHGPAPWDIGRPQPALVRLASEGEFAAAVLDVGCGTGENALHVASLGFSVLGVDVAETALAIAREKAAERRIQVEFVAGDAFQQIPKVPGTFDFVFLDAWKKDYKRFFDMVYPRLDKHGLFLAHNVVNKRSEMGDFLDAIQKQPSVWTTIVSPSGEGMSVTLKR